jgi:hypothetical protein
MHPRELKTLKVEMCEACEGGDHPNCGMQTWCRCDHPLDGNHDYFPEIDPYEEGYAMNKQLSEVDREVAIAESKFQTEMAQIWSPQILGELQSIADCASRLDVLWGNDEDEEGDDAAFCETMAELRKTLRPWRDRRALTASGDEVKS